MRAFPFQAASILVLSTALASPARADDRWSATLQFIEMSAAGLPDLVMAGVGEVRREVTPHLHLTLRLGAGYVSTDNETWNIAQTHILAQVGGGVGTKLGRVTLSADLHLGALIISELDTREQAQELAAANISGREQSSVAAGPLADIELAADIQLIGRWNLRLSAGPQVSYISVDSELRLHGGVFGGLGVTCAF